MPIKSIIFLLIFTITGSIFAQGNNLSSQNLSNVNVSSLTDAQIIQYNNQAQSSGLSESQVEAALASRGMPQAQIQELKNRIAQIKTAGSKSDANKISSGDPGRELSSNIAETAAVNQDKGLEDAKSRIFGASLFNNKNLTFEPNLRIPTPKNYTLGPDDELIIDVFGISQQSYKCLVSPEGSIKLDIIGPVSVNGLTVEQAAARIKSRLAQIYAGIDFNNQVQVTLGNIRSIKITMIGEVTLPGTYTLPSLASAFNALYSAGGPSANGSYRNIQVIRNNKVVRTLDMYDFLLNGNQKDNIRLEDQDIIKIQTYDTRIELSGEIKRSGIYEAIKGESLAKIIEYAGGYTDRAFTESIKAVRYTGKEKTVLDINQKNINSTFPKRGDKYIIEAVLDRFQNRVIISGSVYRPGVYALDSANTLLSLINRANGLTDDAFISRIVINRKNPDLSPKVLAIELDKIMAGSLPNETLLKDDSVVIYSKSGLEDTKDLSINGTVRKPGNYIYASNMHVEDLILMAGGLKEEASLYRVEIGRRVTNSDFTSNASEYAEIIQLDIDQNLKSKNPNDTNLILQPYDVVTIRRTQNYIFQEIVEVTGEVNYSGEYVIANKSERISDLITRAGGLSPEAYPEGAFLLRQKQDSELERQKKVKQTLRFDKNTKNDSTDKAVLKDDLLNPYETVAIDLKKILKRPLRENDLIIQGGDIIKVPTLLQTIRINGEVLYPVSLQYQKNKSFKNYVNKAGGFSDQAKRRRCYVVYSNGSVRRTKTLLFIKSYPRISPGSEVFVPQRPERKGITTGETVGISSALASLALVFFTIFNSAR